MAWNASGTFTRVVTTVSPAVGDTTIESSAMNTFTADQTAGINACLAKNGENAATGDMDIGSYKITELADGTASTDAATVGQVQDGGMSYAVSSGTDTITLALTPSVTSLVAGQSFTFKAGGTCTGGGVTLSINGIAAKDVVTNSIASPRAGDISANGVYTVVYDGTQFLLQNPERETDGVFVNDGDGSPSVSGTALDVDGETVDTWVSIGPTAASPDTIWAPLDSVPDDIDWIEVAIYIAASETATNLGLYVYAKKNGSAETLIAENTIAIARCDDGTSNAKNVQIMSRGIKIPVDADNAFEVQWTESGSAAKDILLYLTGYGWN